MPPPDVGMPGKPAGAGSVRRGAVRAAEIEQARRVVSAAHVEHLTHDDGVVATVVRRPRAAIEPRERAVKDRCAGDFARAGRLPGELVHAGPPAGGEPTGDV